MPWAKAAELMAKAHVAHPALTPVSANAHNADLAKLRFMTTLSRSPVPADPGGTNQIELVRDSAPYFASIKDSLNSAT
jgi:hypothetical protein